MGYDMGHTPSGIWEEYYHVGLPKLLLLTFLVCTDAIICDNGVAHKFQESPTSVERKVLLRLGR
jgi:hypothetical protein